MKKYSQSALGLFGVALAILVAFVLPILPAVATEPDLQVQTRTDGEIMDQINEIEAKLAILQALFEAAASSKDSMDEQPGLTITVNGDVLRMDSTIVSRADAITECETVAYNTAYMWQLVTCDFSGEQIYSDVFIAG